MFPFRRNRDARGEVSLRHAYFGSGRSGRGGKRDYAMQAIVPRESRCADFGCGARFCLRGASRGYCSRHRFYRHARLRIDCGRSGDIERAGSFFLVHEFRRGEIVQGVTLHLRCGGCRCDAQLWSRGHLGGGPLNDIGQRHLDLWRSWWRVRQMRGRWRLRDSRWRCTRQD